MKFLAATGRPGTPIEISAKGHDELRANTQESQGVWRGYQTLERFSVLGTLP